MRASGEAAGAGSEAGSGAASPAGSTASGASAGSGGSGPLDGAALRRLAEQRPLQLALRPDVADIDGVPGECPHGNSPHTRRRVGIGAHRPKSQEYTSQGGGESLQTVL